MKPYSASQEKPVKSTQELRKIFTSFGIGVLSLIIIALVSASIHSPTKKKLESSKELTEQILVEEKEMPIMKLYFMLKNNVEITQDARSEELKIIHSFTSKVETVKNAPIQSFSQSHYIQYLHLISLQLLLELKKARSPLLSLYINSVKFPINNYIPGISQISFSASQKSMTDFQLEALLLSIEEKLESIEKISKTSLFN